MRAVRYQTSYENQYLCPMVEDYVLQQVDGITVNENTKLDHITSLLINTRQIRLGKKPNPESLVQIRKVIQHALDTNTAIPILTPSGPKKPGSDGALDIAELSALRTLSCLIRQIRRVHPPSANIRIRLEDTTGILLEGFEPMLASVMNAYCTTFNALCYHINHSGGGPLHPIKESDMSNVHRMVAFTEEAFPTFLKVLQGADPQLVNVLGWKGTVTPSAPFVLSLKERFVQLFPSWNEESIIQHIAKYMANILARVKTGCSGWDEAWAPQGAIEISFAPPTPASPTVSRRLYYRTVPLKASRRHLPFWRAKGLLRIKGNTVRPVLRHWYDSVPVQKGSIVFEDDPKLVIQADILMD